VRIAVVPPKTRRACLRDCCTTTYLHFFIQHLHAGRRVLPHLRAGERGFFSAGSAFSRFSFTCRRITSPLGLALYPANGSRFPFMLPAMPPAPALITKNIPLWRTFVPGQTGGGRTLRRAPLRNTIFWTHLPAGRCAAAFRSFSTTLV